jgi:hypothetical protein
LRRRAAVAIVLAAVSASLACNAILGNADGIYVQTDGGGGDVLPTDSAAELAPSSDAGSDGATPDADAAAPDGPVVSDAQQGDGTFCSTVTPGYVFCADFGSNPNASPVSFVTGGDTVTDGQATIGLTAETSVSPPLSMLAMTAATDASPQAVITEPLASSDGGLAIPSYIAFDLLVEGTCQPAAGGAAGATLVFYKLGTAGVYAEIDLTLNEPGYVLHTSTATVDAGILSPASQTFSVSAIPFGAWAAVRLDFAPSDAGAATVTLSANQVPLGSTTLSTAGTSTPPFDPTVGEVHLGIGTFRDTAACTAYYDNFVIGALLP